MPQIGLGLWRTADGEAATLVRSAVEAGYRLVDTAAAYGNERGVGEGLRSSEVGSSVFVTTKLWNDDQGYDRTLRAFEASLRRLQLATVDLYLIHWPAPARGLYVDSWRALVRLKAEGRARSIGVSNFGSAHLHHIICETGETPVVNQVELHPWFQQRALRSICAGLGVRTQCWSPLGQGQLLRDPTILRIATRQARTPAQVVIRWHLENGFIVIPKSANPERIRENIDILDFRLTPSDLDTITGLDRAGGRMGLDPAAAPM